MSPIPNPNPFNHPKPTSTSGSKCMERMACSAADTGSAAARGSAELPWSSASSCSRRSASWLPDAWLKKVIWLNQNRDSTSWGGGFNKYIIISLSLHRLLKVNQHQKLILEYFGHSLLCPGGSSSINWRISHSQLGWPEATQLSADLTCMTGWLHLRWDQRSPVLFIAVIWPGQWKVYWWYTFYKSDMSDRSDLTLLQKARRTLPRFPSLHLVRIFSTSSILPTSFPQPDPPLFWT